MAAMSDYLEGQIINHIFRNTAIFTPPATVYVALCTAAPTDADTGSTIVEPTTGGYARAAVSTTGGWTAPGVGGLTDNTGAITWTNSAATVWNVTHIAIVSATSGGNVYLHGALTTSKSVAQNDSFTFAIGALDITFA